MDMARMRSLAELGFPGFLAGLIGGVVAGGLTAVAGQTPAWALTAMVTLGLPLGLFGMGYGLLVVKGIARPGTFAPAALFWLIGFPLSRLLQEVLTRAVVVGEPGLPPDLLGFFAYQGIVSAGFAIGFLWMHERIAPQWWRKVADRNPDAGAVFQRYVAHSRLLYEQREQRRKARAARARR
ncbi:hypothetical protein EWH70_31970 [Amycolatopsis suaedae]|uniref:Uncharacterized protein n=1 Tax=Amycolatopsis suaedae TaxID=2510978 RepID=A0A4Q7IZG5_9PSEU|nr:hypothetical protein EWH70_31970 [Amycolatopsis suaedae]